MTSWGRWPRTPGHHSLDVFGQHHLRDRPEHSGLYPSSSVGARPTPSTFSSRIFVTRRPTPAQIAPGGNLAWQWRRGHVLVQHQTTTIRRRYGSDIPPSLSDLALLATFADRSSLRIPVGADGMLPSRSRLPGPRRQSLATTSSGAVGEQGHDKIVTFKDYGPTRVVLVGEPAKSANELLYAGSVGQPPHSTIGNYVVNTIFWDWGSARYGFSRPSADATQWATYSGPLGLPYRVACTRRRRMRLSTLQTPRTSDTSLSLATASIRGRRSSPATPRPPRRLPSGFR